MKKILVIGAGVSGLTSARIVRDFHDVEIWDKESEIGGIAKTRSVPDGVFHITGGHCFNSKYKEVLDFVFSIYPKSEWNEIDRRAKIYFKEEYYDYPIEFSLGDIAKKHPEFVDTIKSDLLKIDDRVVENLADWFRVKFGETLAESYFIPYNKKIWGMDPKCMAYEWVADKLPNPSKEDILESLETDKVDKMPHAKFFYSKSNDQNDFLRELAKGTVIKLNAEVKELEKKGNQWLVNGTSTFDEIIYTGPLDLLSRITETPKDVMNEVDKLKYNKITSMLWEGSESDQTWTYYPEKNTIFHRHIHIGNFFKPRTNLVITEAMGEVSRDEMIAAGSKFQHLKNPLDYNVSDHAYVLFDANCRDSSNVAINYYRSKGLRLVGRFAEWDYFNMDVCIKSALDQLRDL